VLFLLKESATYSRLMIISWFISSVVIMVSWRLLHRYQLKRSYAKGKFISKAAIIGHTKTGLNLFQEITNNNLTGIKLVGIFDDRTSDRLNHDATQLQGRVKDALTLAQNSDIDTIYICLPMHAEERIDKIIRTLSDSTIDVHIVPDFFLTNIMHGEINHLGSVSTISVFQQPVFGMNEFYKRAFDVLFSACALIGLAPLLFIIALSIKLTSKGPVLFKQDRYGMDGLPIKVHKFRSMTVMENSDKVVQAKKGDARITKVGAFLRRTSLDELPQFYDVLVGRMSVVGPRPHAVAHNEEYRKIVDFYMLRHKVKPGITGLAQINGWRGETDTLEKMEKRIEYDLKYIQNWTIWWDIKIVFWTIFKGFINKNAY
jgi:putative colanic acid biosynthesis UDP-glucose lipid carrier transferase